MLPMKVEHFSMVVKYQIQSRALNHFFTPNSNVIENVKLYNTLRAKNAHQKANQLDCEIFSNALRSGKRVVQFNTVPNNATCVITKQPIREGKTLVIYNEEVQIFCVQQRFLPIIYEYYTIVHFDEEIFKCFKRWVSSVYKTDITKDNIDGITNNFLTYNNASKINFLYVKFNKICNL